MGTAGEVIQYIMSMHEEKKRKAIILLWMWWTERNGAREGNRRRDARIVAQRVEAYAAEVASLVYKERSTNRGKNVARWERPPNECVKLNCDRSFMPGSATGGWGYVIRDEDGDVISAARGRIDSLSDAFHAEIVACLHGVQGAIDLGL
ncbi:hypothetical protein ACP70R_028395 [Stipagrostis hirtigluma subsp. patula]